MTCVQYLQANLPFDVSFLKYAQYLHPEKRSDAKATSAISNISLKITTILENCLPVVFNMKTPVTKEEVCDKVRNQWLYYQNEEIKEEWYRKSEEEMQSTSSRKQTSYWKDATEKCGLNTDLPVSRHKRIDYYWEKKWVD